MMESGGIIVGMFEWQECVAGDGANRLTAKL